MPMQARTSEFRVEKVRSRATITLSSGESVQGCFFVARSGVRVPGPERVGDILNSEPGFCLFEIQDDDGVRTVLYNRTQIVSVEVVDDEAQRDPGYDVATERLVSIRLASGLEIVGSVRVYLPEGHDRLSDWARQPDQFRYVETGESTLLVNVAHIIEMTEIRP
jgi:hypothetical protein